MRCCVFSDWDGGRFDVPCIRCGRCTWGEFGRRGGLRGGAGELWFGGLRDLLLMTLKTKCEAAGEPPVEFVISKGREVDGSERPPLIISLPCSASKAALL